MNIVTKNKTKSARRKKGVILPVGVRKVVSSETRKVCERGENGKFQKAEPVVFETVENSNGVDVVLEGSVRFNGRETIRSSSSAVKRIRSKRESQINKLSRDFAKSQKGSESNQSVTDASLLAMAE